VSPLVLRISARAVSAERVGPAISVRLLSGLFSSGMFTLPAPLEGRAGGQRVPRRPLKRPATIPIYRKAIDSQAVLCTTCLLVVRCCACRDQLRMNRGGR
jgi:hypothetical protein